MSVLVALRRLPPLETAIVALAVAILATLAAVGGARNAAHLDSFSSYDAASGGYRAYYALLEREGFRVERFERRPAFLDADVDTLVYVEPYAFDPRRVPLAKSDVAALEAWVRGGGHLLYIGSDDVAAKAGVLHLPSSIAARASARGGRVAPDLARAGATEVASSTPLRWNGRKDARVLLDDGRGALVVTYAFGRGRVTALVDEALFRNDGIATRERARLAVALAAPSRPHGVVSFDELPHGYSIPAHWWQVVPRAFAFALALAVAAILIAIAGAAVRFGPPLVPLDRRDRSSADFIDALSTLFERAGAMRKASLDAATSASRAVARALGLGDESSHDEVASRIEDGELRRAYREMFVVAENGFANDANLVRSVALAQRLRKEFAARGRSRI